MTIDAAMVLRRADHASRHVSCIIEAMKSKVEREAASAAQKNQPLVDDIRLLGRILGEVIREQEGAAAY
jgi:phosphoenolpyruvate carboxylase